MKILAFFNKYVYLYMHAYIQICTTYEKGRASIEQVLRSVFQHSLSYISNTVDFVEAIK